MSDYAGQPGDLLCQRSGCGNVAQDGWWLVSGRFRFACLEHADAERTGDAPDGVLDMPPGYDASAMNPANVPMPKTSAAYQQACRPIRPAMRAWVRKLLLELNGNDDDVAKILGDGYRDVESLSHHAGGWLVMVLQTAVLQTAPVGSDE